MDLIIYFFEGMTQTDYPANSLIHILITCYFENEIMILVNMIYVNRLTKFMLIPKLLIE